MQQVIMLEASPTWFIPPCFGVSPTRRPPHHIKGVLSVRDFKGESRKIDCHFLQMERKADEPVDDGINKIEAYAGIRLLLNSRMKKFEKTVKGLQSDMDSVMRDVNTMQAEDANFTC